MGADNLAGSRKGQLRRGRCWGPREARDLRFAWNTPSKERDRQCVNSKMRKRIKMVVCKGVNKWAVLEN